jgi:two-component system response regulator PilR (NtrC family)
VDVRLVSATHRDLAALVKSGEFRQDLFYRLNVIGLRTPALRERREDLSELAHALLKRICSESAQPVPALSSTALAWLQTCELPGNVRELENLLQRALALSSGAVLQAEDFGDTSDTAMRPESPSTATAFATPAPVSASATGIPADLQTYLDEQERRVLLKALKETDFNRTAAAARLGLNLRQMRYRIQRLGITTPADGDDET